MRRPDGLLRRPGPVTVIPPLTDRTLSVAFVFFGTSSSMRPFVLSIRTRAVTSAIFTEMDPFTEAASTEPRSPVSSTRAVHHHRLDRTAQPIGLHRPVVARHLDTGIGGNRHLVAHLEAAGPSAAIPAGAGDTHMLRRRRLLDFRFAQDLLRTIIGHRLGGEHSRHLDRSRRAHADLDRAVDVDDLHTPAGRQRVLALPLPRRPPVR